MNKTAIKNFAVWARNKLIADISYKAGLMGIAEDGIKSALPQSTKGTAFFDIGTKEPYSISGDEVKQRNHLADLITAKAASLDYKTAYRNVVEEVAYTWFNRLIAIRFMEVNDYLPSRIRVLSSEGSSKLEPDLVTTPFDAELELTDAETEQIVKLKNDNNVDECFRLLFVKQCNALNAILPNLFEKTSDYTELLLNVSVTDQDGVVYHLVHDIDEDDFNIEKGGQVEIIGWLYQYYNTEPKDEAFALLKKNIKITKERIPAATQLFTPDWIVRYMVENSLGRLWLEGHPNDDLKSEWKYYLEEAEQEADVQAQLDKIREDYKTIKPEDIKIIDPCMGSGHILVYAFDVLIQIYEAAGYTQRDAAKSILENNIYGLDIDDRAFQLAYFAVMMKARQYNRRVLNGESICHVYSIQESNGINRNQLQYFGAGMSDIEKNDVMNQLTSVLDTFMDAKEYGSILNVEKCNWELLRKFTAGTNAEVQLSIDTIGIDETKAKLQLLIDIGQIMSQEYDVVVTNPPYMGSNSMSTKLTNYIKKYYPESKADLFAVFIEKCDEMICKNGFQAMITQHAWMFLSSFEKLRVKMLKSDFVSMVHLGSRAFEEISGEVVQTTSFVRRQGLTLNYAGKYCRLIKPSTQKGKEDAFLAQKELFTAKQCNYEKIPGSPIAYWISEHFAKIFDMYPKLGDFVECAAGISTGNNDLYLKLWPEVDLTKIAKGIKSEETFQSSGYTYAYCNKGGTVRKWYGNNDYVAKWCLSEQFHRNGATYKHLLFIEGITWSEICMGNFSSRYYKAGQIFDHKSPGMFVIDDNMMKIYLGLLNSKVTASILNVINPTISTGADTLRKIPIKLDGHRNEAILANVNSCVDISKHDWDSFETSWEFTDHPLVKWAKSLCDCTAIGETMDLYYGADKPKTVSCPLELCYLLWQGECNEHFNTLKANEEELNRIFIDIYGLQDELTPEVADKDVTVRKADLTRDIKSLISYAVGCMFGRYSLDTDGLAYAGGEWNDEKYRTFIPDTDNIIPITDEEYFPDDIVGLFCGWLKKVYGEDSLEENLDYIAHALGNKGNSSREVIRNYFLGDFIKDHNKIYQKRPIYWLFDSGKQNGFKALVYMHRYDENTIGNLRIDYLHRMERVYESEIHRMQDTMDSSTNSREVVAATKRKEKLQKQVKECKEYDEKIAHLALARIAIDLDDGVKVNYEKVQTSTDGKKYQVLAKL
ncbi:restriction endonuclease [Clostridium sp. chh4-2]|uniref:BREX-1 system adenine-specific DNA-methyltransferase PglX n=1 Tax=Clostridium sp. chh4-2 TaxID=2067550 RepID=UPI000CCE91DD|nr:BREX-1 system adenine-specific DNA-methyltransferase PglX [Clostridium sp. chh4-2]PNV62532.1 restriction endonuclease [Clostridium sp. chh4-2]